MFPRRVAIFTGFLTLIGPPAETRAALAPGWTAGPQPNVNGLNPSLAFHPTTGRPGISYMVSFTSGGYVQFNGSTWDSIPVASGVSYGRHSNAVFSSLFSECALTSRFFGVT